MIRVSRKTEDGIEVTIVLPNNADDKDILEAVMAIRKARDSGYNRQDDKRVEHLRQLIADTGESAKVTEVPPVGGTPAGWTVIL